MKVGAHRASLRLTFVAIVAFAAATLVAAAPVHAQSDGADATAPETPAPLDAAAAPPSAAAAQNGGGTADAGREDVASTSMQCEMMAAAEACERSAEVGLRLPEPNRLRQGSVLELPLDDNAITDAGVCFSLQGADVPGLSGQAWIATEEGRRLLRLRVPRFESLNRVEHARAMVEPCMEVSLSAGGEKRVVRWRIEVVSPRAAWMGALASVLVMLGLGWLLTKSRLQGLLTSPNGQLSLSLSQFFLWTLVTVFGLVYVWLLTETVLALPTEVLALLGISAGTAVGGRVQALSRVTRLSRAAQKYIQKADGLRRKPGGPSDLSDLIDLDGRPSLAKLQMLIFTVLAVGMVLWSMLEHYAFPVLNTELVVLMGLSGATYLGSQSVAPVSLEQVEAKVKEAEAGASGDDAKKKEATEAVAKYLGSSRPSASEPTPDAGAEDAKP